MQTRRNPPKAEAQAMAAEIGGGAPRVTTICFIIIFNPLQGN